jgi:integrase
MNAWNRNKSLGKKPPLEWDQVQAIKVALVKLGTTRDRALFALAIDSSLRGHDLLQLRRRDVCGPEGMLGQIRVRPSKTQETTGKAVVFEPLPYTIQLMRELIEEEEIAWDGFLFVRTQKISSKRPALSERAYQNLVKNWVSYIGLNPELYGTHSLRRTRPAHIYKNTGNLRVCQVILGHASITNTQEYLGIEENEALDISRKFAF